MSMLRATLGDLFSLHPPQCGKARCGAVATGALREGSAAAGHEGHAWLSPIQGLNVALFIGAARRGLRGGDRPSYIPSRFSRTERGSGSGGTRVDRL